MSEGWSAFPALVPVAVTVNGSADVATATVIDRFGWPVLVALVSGDTPVTRKQAEEVARLAAAAPALVDALKEARRMMRQSIHGDDAPETYDIIDAALALAGAI